VGPQFSPLCGSREIDVAGLRLVGDWIASLTSEPEEPSSGELLAFLQSL